MEIKTSIFRIHPQADLELIWQDLEECGCRLLYSEADDHSLQIFGDLPEGMNKKNLLKQFPQLVDIEPIELPEIDWEAQWSVHENYQEGFLQVNLKTYAEEQAFDRGPPLLKLIPGPGFGDLSHPTTRLVLRLMSPFVSHREVIDVGCGSGILSLAAAAMGAKAIIGLDIDEKALTHSRANSENNQMSNKIHFFFPEAAYKVENHSVVLMNMIQSEQVIAWQSLTSVKDHISIAVTSGILKEGRADYLKQCKLWGWQLMEELEEEGWLGFVFFLQT